MAEEEDSFLQFRLESVKFSSPKKRSPKRIPIFDKSGRKQTENWHISFIEEQQISPKKTKNIDSLTLYSDYCGCEKSLNVCQKLKTIMKGINMEEMRQSYDEDRILKQQLSIRFEKKLGRKVLFQSLPSFYPEIFHTQLKNLLLVIQYGLSFGEFCCLAWILYHTKFEHLAYFIFRDLKSSYCDKKKFINKLDRLLIPLGTTYSSQRCRYEDSTFDLFVSDFYNSIGASIIPIVHYGKLIRLLFSKGHGILCQLLISLLKIGLGQLLLWYKEDSQENYRKYVHDLNWEVIFQTINA